MNELLQLFQNNNQFVKLETSGMELVCAVFASPDQIFAISSFPDEKALQDGWEEAALEFAVNVQSRLSGPHDSLRWDMYLLLTVENSDVSLETKVRIENNRLYFRKIVLSSSDRPFSRKLPITTKMDEEIIVSGASFLFEQKHFLEELKKISSQHVLESIDERFFLLGAENAEQLLNYLTKNEK